MTAVQRPPKPIPQPHVFVTCVCGKPTAEFFVVRNRAGRIVSCWVTLEPDHGFASPGCVPDPERTDGLIERRNANIRSALNPTVKRATMFIMAPESARVRCKCDRQTIVFCSNLLLLRYGDVETISDPPDPRVPVMSTSCWLAFGANNERIAGCAPDNRTADILERQQARRSLQSARDENARAPQPAQPAPPVAIRTAPPPAPKPTPPPIVPTAPTDDDEEPATVHQTPALEEPIVQQTKTPKPKKPADATSAPKPLPRKSAQKPAAPAPELSLFG